jgi:hypothetical protein
MREAKEERKWTLEELAEEEERLKVKRRELKLRRHPFRVFQ